MCTEAKETSSKSDIFFTLILLTDISQFFTSPELSSISQLLPCNSLISVHSVERHTKIIKVKLF